MQNGISVDLRNRSSRRGKSVVLGYMTTIEGRAVSWAYPWLLMALGRLRVWGWGLGVGGNRILSLGFGVGELRTSTKNALSRVFKVLINC